MTYKDFKINDKININRRIETLKSIKDGFGLFLGVDNKKICRKLVLVYQKKLKGKQLEIFKTLL